MQGKPNALKNLILASAVDRRRQEGGDAPARATLEKIHGVMRRGELAEDKAPTAQGTEPQGLLEAKFTCFPWF